MDQSILLWSGRPLEYWVAALHDPDDEVRWNSIDALRHLAHPSRTIKLFVGALRDPYWRVRALAAHSIYDMAHQEEFVPLLQQAVIPLAHVLSDECVDVGLNAAYALELLGSHAEYALPQLREAVKHGDNRLREAASDAILKISV